RIEHKRVCRIGQNTPCDVRTSTCVNHAPNPSSRYVAQWHWQANLLHPGIGSGSKLPDVGDPNSVGNVKPAQNVELIVQDGEPTGEYSAKPGRPLCSSKSSDDISNRVVTKDAASPHLGSHIRTAHAVDEVCAAIIKHA